MSDKKMNDKDIRRRQNSFGPVKQCGDIEKPPRKHPAGDQRIGRHAAR